MEQSEQTQLDQRKQQVSEDRKVHAENMRLKKYIKQLEEELDALKKFVGG